MGTYVVKRVARGLAVLSLVSTAVFGMSLLAGDPIKLLIPPETTREQLEALRAAYGLSDPVPARFARFLGQISRGDFGYSFRYREPVLPIVRERLGASLELALAAMAVTVVLALPAGIVAAVKRDSVIDTAVIAASVAGQSVPAFVVGLTLIYLGAVKFRLLPTSGAGTLAHLVMPALTLGAFYSGRVARLVRSTMLEALSQDYIRTARAKGLGETFIVWRHGLKNASLSVVTLLGLELGALFGGAVVTETVFAWPGIGRLAVDAVMARDYPLVQAVVVVVALGFVLVNLVVDLTYTVLDPRVRDMRA